MKVYRFALGIRVRRLASCVDASIKSIVACMLTKFFARHARNQSKIVPILCKNLPLGGFAALFISITHEKQRFFCFIFCFPKPLNKRAVFFYFCAILLFETAIFGVISHFIIGIRQHFGIVVVGSENNVGLLFSVFR